MRKTFLPLLLVGLAPMVQAQDALQGVVINEILADPNSATENFDTDGDGTAETDDEFVELYNASGTPVDISGWQIYDNFDLAHTFDAGTVLAPGGYIAVVAAYDPGPPPPGSNIVAANVSTLGFGNGGDTAFLYNPASQLYIAASYNGNTSSFPDATIPATQSGNGDDFGSDTDGLSIQRSPDGSNAFLVAGPTPGGANATLTGPQEITVSFGSASDSAAEDAGAVTIPVTVSTNNAQPIERNITVEVSFDGGDADASDFADVPPTTRQVTFTIGTASASEQDVTFTLVDDADDEGNEQANFSLSDGFGGDPDSFGQTTYTLTIIDNDAPPATSPIVINEVDADQPGTDDAEFVELFNTSATTQSLDGLVLVVFNGSNGLSYGAVDLDGQSIAPGGRFVICFASAALSALGLCDLDASGLVDNGSIQNGEDAVALYQGDAADFASPTQASTNNLIDAVVYETGSDTDTDLPTLLGTGVVFDELSGPTAGANYSVQRFPDGTGSFVVDVATPGVQNIPVELAQPLAARADAGRLVLTWATASETNNAYFEVLARSSDAAAFAKLGQVDGAGTTAAPQQYALALDNLAPGTYRFRLRQVDLDGTAEIVSETEASVSLAGTHRVSAAWPNPSVGTARIAVSAARAQHVTVHVYDALGRLVATALDADVEAQQSREVTLGAGLVPGAYVAVVTGERFREVRRFMISR